MCKRVLILYQEVIYVRERTKIFNQLFYKRRDIIMVYIRDLNCRIIFYV